MKRVQRFDIHRLDQIKRTPEGYIETSVRATRTGVFLYKGADGKPFRELRLPDEVFNPDSMQSLAMKPVTNDHPFELVNIDNVKEHQIGYTGENINRSDNYLDIGRVVITDKQAIADVEKGKQEVSCGYSLDLDFVQGYWDGNAVNQDGRGEPFDAIQRNIKYNHLALVHRGRAGSQARLRLDSEHNLVTEEDTEMVKIKINGKEFDCSPELAAAFESYETKIAKDKADADAAVKEAMKQASETRDAMAAKDSEIESMKGKQDAMDAELKDAKDPEKFNTRVRERMHLVSTATAILGAKDEKELAHIDGLSDMEIMKEVIKKQNETVSFDGKSDDYIRGQFEVISERYNDGNADGQNFGKKIVKGREDRGNEDICGAEKKRMEALQRDKEAWKKPVGPLAAAGQK